MITNSPPKLGTHTLLPGKARIFIKTGDSVAFTGEDWVQLTPVDREMKLYIGQSRDVKVTQRKVKDDKQNMRRNTGNNVVLWDTDEELKIEIENFKKEDAEPGDRRAHSRLLEDGEKLARVQEEGRLHHRISPDAAERVDRQQEDRRSRSTTTA